MFKLGQCLNIKRIILNKFGTNVCIPNKSGCKFSKSNGGDYLLCLDKNYCPYKKSIIINCKKEVD